MNRWLPLLLLLLLAPFSQIVDLGVSNLFFDSASGKFSQHPVFVWLYNYPPFISFGVVLVALLYLIGSIFKRSWRTYSRPCLVFVLTYCVGAGLIVNAGFKEFWGRPRPVQCVEFGGKQEFRTFWQPNFFSQPEPSKAFTCGHCTAGFLYLSLVFIGRRQRSRTFIATGWIMGLSAGALMSLTRIAQGGHFVTDCVASAVVMWYTAKIADWMLYDH